MTLAWLQPRVITEEVLTIQLHVRALQALEVPHAAKVDASHGLDHYAEPAGVGIAAIALLAPYGRDADVLGVVALCESHLSSIQKHLQNVLSFYMSTSEPAVVGVAARALQAAYGWDADVLGIVALREGDLSPTQDHLQNVLSFYMSTSEPAVVGVAARGLYAGMLMFMGSLRSVKTTCLPSRNTCKSPCSDGA